MCLSATVFTLEQPIAAKTFLRECRYFRPSFEGIHLTQRHEILLQNTRDSMLSYGEKLKSLSHPGSERYRDVTDGQTARQRELSQLIRASSRA